jgi:hypothetical protein
MDREYLTEESIILQDLIFISMDSVLPESSEELPSRVAVN